MAKDFPLRLLRSTFVLDTRSLKFTPKVLHPYVNERLKADPCEGGRAVLSLFSSRLVQLFFFLW